MAPVPDVVDHPQDELALRAVVVRARPAVALAQRVLRRGLEPRARGSHGRSGRAPPRRGRAPAAARRRGCRGPPTPRPCGRGGRGSSRSSATAAAGCDPPTRCSSLAKTRCEERKASSPRASHTTSSAWPTCCGDSAIRIRLPSMTPARSVVVPETSVDDRVRLVVLDDVADVALHPDAVGDLTDELVGIGVGAVRDGVQRHAALSFREGRAAPRSRRRHRASLYAYAPGRGKYAAAIAWGRVLPLRRVADPRWRRGTHRVSNATRRTGSVGAALDPADDEARGLA